jgi:formylglycine-generating enzyme required for sulfatase activity
VSLGFMDPVFTAQEDRWRMAMDSSVLTLEQEKALAARLGSEFKECANGCPVMIVIPAGKFIMGSPENEPDRDTSEGPLHEVTIAKPFAVSKFEVTFEEWDACVVAAACPRAPDGWGRGEMPVINVSWRDAKQYVAWLSQLTGKEYRLLTEAEWEYAARAGANTRYSWGEDRGPIGQQEPLCPWRVSSRDVNAGGHGYFLNSDASSRRIAFASKGTRDLLGRNAHPADRRR